MDTFVVNEIYLAKFVEAFSVEDFIRVEGACVKRKVGRDGGMSSWALYADATTVVVKAKPFDCIFQLFLEHRIKGLLSNDASSSVALTNEVVSIIAFTVVKIENSTKCEETPYCLIVTDDPSHFDRASVSVFESQPLSLLILRVNLFCFL
ncbi:hypothetical protein L7F22_016986 [Adiantum nelumboides]|nr:hypothetical protein [Adiantum nelumboides]